MAHIGYDSRMTPQPVPTARTERSRAAAVSAALRKAGYRPTPSGSTRVGVLQVRPSVNRVSVMVDLSLVRQSDRNALMDALAAALRETGYLIDEVKNDVDISLARIYVRRDTW